MTLAAKQAITKRKNTARINQVRELAAIIGWALVVLLFVYLLMRIVSTIHTSFFTTDYVQGAPLELDKAVQSGGLIIAH